MHGKQVGTFSFRIFLILPFARAARMLHAMQPMFLSTLSSDQNSNQTNDSNSDNWQLLNHPLPSKIAVNYRHKIYEIGLSV